mgnify:CR=1 FL=1
MTMPLARSTRVPIALRFRFPTMRSPSQCPGMIRSLTSSGRSEMLKKSIIVDFNAVWCGPCKQLAPILDEFVKQQNGKVELIKIDVDQNQELAEALKIEAIPYVERYENGNLSWKKLGLFPASELK